jgi:hypothetical protein
VSNRKEIASNLVVILFGLLFLAYTTRYPLDSWENPGPAVFPLIVGSVLTLLGFWQLGQVLWKGKSGDHESIRHDGAGWRSLLDNSGDGKAVRMLFLFALYVLGMQWIGFFVSTFLFGTLTGRLIEAKGWGRHVALSSGLTLFCYLLFEGWLKLSFRRGILF